MASRVSGKARNRRGYAVVLDYEVPFLRPYDDGDMTGSDEGVKGRLAGVEQHGDGRPSEACSE